jgi:short-subunit dehydrogenase
MKKSAIVTGASRGLGRELAIQLSKIGYDLILVGRDGAELAETVKSCYSISRFAVVNGDLTLATTLAEIEIFAQERGVDLLINNAAVYVRGVLDSFTESEIISTMCTNLIAPMLLTRRIFPIFKAQKSGMIININSMAGKYGGPLETVYAASKHGLAGFSQTLLHESLEHNVRVLDVFPGAMNTGMLSFRTDRESCIDPKEAAEQIIWAAKHNHTLNVSELHLTRSMRATVSDPRGLDGGPCLR